MKSKIVELNIDEMIFGGESINNTAFDKKVVLKGGIKGQKVSALIQKSRRDKFQGKILSVIEKSSLENQEVCSKYGQCGGCSMLSVDYDHQLSLKSEQLTKLFHKNGHTEVEKIDIVPSPLQKEYKNKMEFTFGNEVKDGELVIGLHKKNSPMSIVPVEDCLLVDEDYREILKMTGEYFRSKNLPHYHIKSHEGYLRHLVIRKGENTGQLLINIVTTSQLDFDLGEYVQKLQALKLKSTIVGILHTTNDSLSDTVKDDRVDVLYGDNYFYDVLLGNKFKISPFSFFQTNTQGAETLYKTAIEMIDGEKDIIFDLYSGTGTIGISLSTRAKKVIGIEIVEEAVEMAKENAIANNVKNIEFIAGDVKQEISKLTNSPQLIILDPPRAGINPKALNDIIGFNAKQILYISCNPKMLVQDLKVLKEAGYEIVKTKGVDMFPNTYHVETVALLSKLDVDKHIDVEIKLDELDLTSAESKATYAQIKEYILEKFDLKVSTLYIAQIKKKCGIALREHYNKSKKEKQVIPQCTPEKEEAIMDALRHFKMI